jgi:hypothetical protein
MTCSPGVVGFPSFYLPAHTPTSPDNAVVPIMLSTPPTTPPPSLSAPVLSRWSLMSGLHQNVRQVREGENVSPAQADIIIIIKSLRFYYYYYYYC